VEKEAKPPVEEALREAAQPVEKKAEPLVVEEAPADAAPPVEKEAEPPAEEAPRETAPVVEEEPGPAVQPEVRALEQLEPVSEAAPPEPERTPKPPEIPVPDINIHEQLTYVEENKTDYTARLQLARALWAANEREDALEHYTRLIRTDEHMDDVINDLQTYAALETNDPRPLQTLGDAYMKQGDMNKALDTYRQAMNRL
jgi:tetratricopeptide (TPR) repeat protein